MAGGTTENYLHKPDECVGGGGEFKKESVLGSAEHGSTSEAASTSLTSSWQQWGGGSLGKIQFGKGQNMALPWVVLRITYTDCWKPHSK